MNKKFDTPEGAERAAWRAAKQITGALRVIKVEAVAQPCGCWIGALHLDVLDYSEVTPPDRRALDGYRLVFCTAADEVEPEEAQKAPHGYYDRLYQEAGRDRSLFLKMAAADGYALGKASQGWITASTKDPDAPKPERKKRVARPAFEYIAFAGPLPWQRA